MESQRLDRNPVQEIVRSGLSAEMPAYRHQGPPLCQGTIDISLGQIVVGGGDQKIHVLPECS
jgi:hypothetical protein